MICGQRLGYTVFSAFVLSAVLGSEVKLNRVRRGWMSGGRPPGAPCAFNPCSVDNFCGNGRTCEIDDNCRHKCTCNQDSEHEACIASVTMANTPLPKKCTFNLCDMPSACGGNRQCSLNGMCRIQCECTSESTHESCVEDSILTSTPVSTATTTNQSSFNICNKGDDATFTSYQTCSEDLQCQHGTCVVHGDHVVCECHPGAAGRECEVRCCLDCGESGVCGLDEDKVEVCRCRHNFTGTNCSLTEAQASIQVAEQSTWYLWVVGVSFAMLLVLLVLLVVLPYWMWRRRVILVMKIIHFFQNYEDDDERQWDAFVSYKSTQVDEQFVVHTLLPKLEKELGFRLHVHFRDFLPGDTIADNILRAVTGSRRTILVVSPEFARAEWTKFEYQVAQQEMLKRKHRIIPIVLEDLAESKDKLEPSLKAILESVTYLEWPKCGNEKKVEKFWKRLELSLPKKRVTSVEQGPEFDTSGYDTIRPDSVDVSFVSEKAEQGLHNGYMTRLKIQDPEEDYATLNEAEMTSDYDKITKNDEELNETNTAMDAKYNLENKTSEKYLNILNGDISMHTIEV